MTNLDSGYVLLCIRDNVWFMLCRAGHLCGENKRGSWRYVSNANTPAHRRQVRSTYYPLVAMTVLRSTMDVNDYAR